MLYPGCSGVNKEMLDDITVLVESFSDEALLARSPLWQEWQKKHWMTLGHYYAHAPFFAKYNDFFRDIYEKKWDGSIRIYGRTR